MEKKHILITGGSGYIGVHVKHVLTQAGYATVVFDNLSRGQSEPTKGVLVKGDLTQRTDVEQLFDSFSFEAVIHLASLIDVEESVADPMCYYATNVGGTLNLLEVMYHHAVRTFVFSSSAAIFGIPQTEQIAEDHPIAPLNPYGWTKSMCEQVLRDYAQAYSLKYCTLRYFNAAGADPMGVVQSPQNDRHHVIPTLIRSIQQQIPFTLYGTDYPTHDGTCIRDYIHVCDLAQAHLLAMEYLLKGGGSGAYNLGNGHGFSVREVVHAVETVTEKTVPLVEGPRRPGDSPRLVADSLKAQTVLGWEPQSPALETIVENAWRRERGRG